MTPLSLPPVADPFQLPFHYGALHQVGLDWLVAPDPVRELLAKHHPGLTAATFDDGRALVSLNYQLYFAQYAFGGGVTQEIEFNVIAFPTAEEARLPRLSYAQYAQGWDQTKLLGIARVHVVCDNPFAIRAGRELYAEPKYPGWFEVALPSLNGPAGDTWTVRCKAAAIGPDDTLEQDDTPLLDLTARLDGLAAVAANSAPITGYGTDREGRLLAGPMNVYQPYRWYDLSAPEHSGRTRVHVHAPDADLGRDVRALLGADVPAAGVWTYQSPPVAAHNRPYYLPTRPRL
ncbi:hypothetical protein [Streptomyces vietnamensis]|uniref:Acetoacetate decarboxylase n=1 Tax=Streptomyces vietnamensis TaxID=362257 RepID=A0A0B5ILA1_9ACTN|nr:hypothetical protein [Streptomyces vietnamensis]AJF69169.1 hypothetical protein SVTN_37710 [Streptomyces vietnamensis]